MVTLTKSFLLFTLNWLDAHLTILWLRLQIAEEGNHLMATLLAYGEWHFLAVKLIIGAFAALVLYRFSNLQLAQFGMRVVLGIYLFLMLVHTATGFSALGWEAPGAVLAYFAAFPKAVLGILS